MQTFRLGAIDHFGRCSQAPLIQQFQWVEVVDRTGFEPVAFRLGIFYSMRLFDSKMFYINVLIAVISER